MKWILLALVLVGCQLPVDSPVVASGGCDVSFKQGRFNKLTVDDLIVTHEINQGLMQQVQSSSRAIGQLNATGFLGDLYVRGQVYQGLGSQWVGPIANSHGANDIFAVAYGGGVFVAVGVGGYISYSTDLGATWSALIANSFGASTINMVVYGNGVFVAVADGGKIAYSTDLGVTWSALVATPFGASNVNGVVYANGAFIAVADAGKIARSTDLGVTWGALLANPYGAGDIIWKISHGYGIVVAVGGGGKIARSNDFGVTWGSLVTNPFGGGPIRSITFGNSVFVAGGDNGLARSIDFGLTWGSLLTTPLGGSAIYSVAFNFGIFQIGAIAGKTARSYDNGATWGSLITNPFGTSLIRGIASSPSNMVAVGAAGSIATAGWNPCYSLVEPVPAEPSNGTPHEHYAVIQNGVPGANSVQVTALPAAIPTGVKWIEGRYYITANAAGKDLDMLDITGTLGYDSIRTQVANTRIGGHFSIPVDSSKNFRWDVTDFANTTTVVIIMTRYWT